MARKGKHAIGIFHDGSVLQLACLIKNQNHIRVVDTAAISLKAETTDVVEDIHAMMADAGNLLEESSDIQFMGEEDGELETDLEPESEDIIQLGRFLDKYQAHNFRLALSLPEPQIYYAHFRNTWEAKGKKLQEIIRQELSKLRAENHSVSDDDMVILELGDDRMLAVVRDTEIEMISMIEAAQTNLSREIHFTEAAEISLLNLIKVSYNFEPDEITIVVFVGQESSRIIFLNGEHLFHISYLIGVDITSENICQTLYSRLLLEQDNLNCPKVDNIILTGSAATIHLDTYLNERLPEGVTLEYINMNHLAVNTESNPQIASFAVPIGAAFRTLHSGDEALYPVDLTPADIKESRKRFKLGWAGWTLLALIPLLAFALTARVVSQKETLRITQEQIRHGKTELADLQEMEEKFLMLQNQQSAYSTTFSVLDSLGVEKAQWTEFLTRLSKVKAGMKNIWVTELEQPTPTKMVLQGFAKERERIPDFATQFPNASLKYVEVQEIRAVQVYRFQLEIELTAEPGGANGEGGPRVL